MNLFRKLVLLLLLTSCKSVILFPERSYYGGGNLFKIKPDNSFEYRETGHGYVYKFSKGTWKQEGNKLLLFNEISDVKNLPITTGVNPSKAGEAQLIINVLPKKDILPSVLELFNVDIVVNEMVHPLKNETNLIQIDQPLGSAYLRAYKKLGSENTYSYTVLNDTLRSQSINLEGMSNKILTIDVDCNPFYFAQIKMPDDTLRIVNDYKIKWGKIYLERPH